MDCITVSYKLPAEIFLLFPSYPLHENNSVLINLSFLNTMEQVSAIITFITRSLMREGEYMTEKVDEKEKQIEELLSSFYERMRATGLSKSLLKKKGLWNKVYTILSRTKNELELLRKEDDVKKARKTIEQIENDISTLLESCGRSGTFQKSVIKEDEDKMKGLETYSL